MIIQEIEIEFTEYNFTKKIFIEYRSETQLTFTEFFYRFIQSDADACKLNYYGITERYYLITKTFIQNKFITINIIKSIKSDEQ